MSSVLVIGGGPAGMMAALAAAEAGAKVRILERNENVGKKLLMTGSGKCNYSNNDMGSDFYNFDEKHEFSSLIDRYNPQWLETFFYERGMLTGEKGTLLYPKSEKAETVRDFFLDLMKEKNVEMIFGKKAIGAQKENNSFLVELEDKSVLRADSVIIATGGKACPQTGSDGAGYRLARAFGHTVTYTYPGLTRLLTEDKEVLKASGLRVKGKVTAVVNDKKVAEEEGEIQFTDKGLSGICIYKLSRYMSKELENNDKCEILIDFCPEMSILELGDYFEKIKKRRPGINEKTILEEIFGKKCAALLTAKSSDTINAVKEMSVRISMHDSFNDAQVTIGGVSTTEVSKTMESKLIDGLYFAGEVLDVDGTCGGYNLHFAFASGYEAGLNAAQR